MKARLLFFRRILRQGDGAKIHLMNLWDWRSLARRIKSAQCKTGKRLVIEVKAEGEEMTAALQASLHSSQVLEEQLSIISFSREFLQQLKAAMSALEVLWLREAPGEGQAVDVQLNGLIALCRQADLSGLHLSCAWPIDRQFAEQVHKVGLQLFVWTVNDGPVARELAQAGVDGITTDRPGWLRRVLE